jgi:hypothetical protein
MDPPALLGRGRHLLDRIDDSVGELHRGTDDRDRAIGDG